MLPIVQSPATYEFEKAFDDIPESKDLEGYDHNLILTTNETNQEKTIAIMKREPLNGQVMVTTSGFFGLNVASIRGKDRQQLTHIVVLDRSVRVQKFWGYMEQIIRESTDLKQVTAEIDKLLTNKANEFWGHSRKPQKEIEILKIERKDLQNEIDQNISWLSSEERFQTIKKIFDEHHFICKRIDFFDKESIAKINEKLSHLKLTIDTLYLSNIKEYAISYKKLTHFHAALNEFKKNSIITDQTFIIDTKPRSGGACKNQGPLIQQIRRKFLTTSIAKSFPDEPQCTCNAQTPSQTADIALKLLSNSNIDMSKIDFDIIAQLSSNLGIDKSNTEFGNILTQIISKIKK